MLVSPFQVVSITTSPILTFPEPVLAESLMLPFLVKASGSLRGVASSLLHESIVTTPQTTINTNNFFIPFPPTYIDSYVYNFRLNPTTLSTSLPYPLSRDLLQIVFDCV